MPKLKYGITLFIAIAMTVLLTSCGTMSGSGAKSEPSGEAAPLKTVYLKNNIHTQVKADRSGKNVYRASYANYTDPGAGHEIIPVNTPVTITTSGGFRGKQILITTKDGKEINFEFNSRNMQMEPEDYFDLITSPTPVSTKGLSGIDQKGIREGKAYKGMSKDGVRMALGYPAVHRTPSLDGDTWTYWRNRFTNLVVEFKNGKVARIRQ